MASSKDNCSITMNNSQQTKSNCTGGTVPSTIRFHVNTPFGLGRLAIPCTESSPTVGIELFNGFEAAQNLICYCDRLRVGSKVCDSCQYLYLLLPVTNTQCSNRMQRLMVTISFVLFHCCISRIKWNKIVLVTLGIIM